MLTDPHFDGFATYLSQRLPTIAVRLNLPGSRFAARTQRTCRGIDDVLASYQWKASWQIGGATVVHSCDWNSTKASLRALSSELRAAIEPNSDQGPRILSIIEAIMTWGGDRNSSQGALPFLKKMADSGTLSAYLRETAYTLALTRPSRPTFEKILAMNAMLSKVHALAAGDGLPIYDSRVAAAIAVLAEQYRRERALPDLPVSIRFPTTDVPGSRHHRHVRLVYPDAVGARVLYRGSPTIATEWSLAMWQLGRLMHLVLRSSPALLAGEGSIANRCHALEAALFMIGYDPRSIAADAAGE